MKEYRDTEYGDYKDFDAYHWSDDFYPIKRIRQAESERFHLDVMALLDDIAYRYGLDPTTWDKNDYEIFMDRMDLYL